MHITQVRFCPDHYPTDQHYPFNLRLFQKTEKLDFGSPVVFFVGENGTGKSTLLQAIAHRCRIHIWQDQDKIRYETNPYEALLYHYIEVDGTETGISGAYFDSELYRIFAQNLDEWAATDPNLLKYFGGHSLLTLSHGQSLLTYFRNRYRIEGLYLLDEPETALSPRSQLKLLDIFKETGRSAHTQFIIATHSPILLSCPGAAIYSFDHIPIHSITYKETEHYRIYKAFMAGEL